MNQTRKMRVSGELLAQLIHLPETAKIVFAKVEEISGGGVIVGDPLVIEFEVMSPDFDEATEDPGYPLFAEDEAGKVTFQSWT